MTYTITTSPYDDQRPGTSGLRKPVEVFQQDNYLENFVQSVFDAVPELAGGILVLGGDGRFHNDIAINTIIRMAVANGVSRLFVAQHGFLSTPAASAAIRAFGATGGILLTASHNSGGPDGDFGIKFNASNGGPATESLTENIYQLTKGIQRYHIVDAMDFELSALGLKRVGETTIEVFDSVGMYADLMEELFDFPALKLLFNNGFQLCFDAMNAITGPYAREIFEERLSAPEGSVIRGEPLQDFGGAHPDPNLVHAAGLVEQMMQSNGPDIGAASDGDGDRNMVMGRQCYVTPSDSLAIMAANADLVPAYREGIVGVARSMPTSRAVDRVASAMGIPSYETPTGWKFFGNLLDAGHISLCGEESFGTGSNHIREKDGIWAVLMWVSIVAARKEDVQSILTSHWGRFGRDYYTRHDYENVDSAAASEVMETLRKQIGAESAPVAWLDEFSYRDPVDGSLAEGQGVRIMLNNDARIVYRLSGTGTRGATLRIYIEKYAPPNADHHQDPQEFLSKEIRVSRMLSRLSDITGREQPNIIT